MKKALFLVLTITIMLTNITSFSQTKRYKFKALRTLNVYLDKYGDYSFSGTWADTSIVIVVDTKEKKAAFYGDYIRKLDMVSSSISYTDDGFTYLKWPTCIDETGAKCSLRILLPNEHDDTNQICVLIDYANITIDFLAIFDL